MLSPPGRELGIQKCSSRESSFDISSFLIKTLSARCIVPPLTLTNKQHWDNDKCSLSSPSFRCRHVNPAMSINNPPRSQPCYVDRE